MFLSSCCFSIIAFRPMMAPDADGKVLLQLDKLARPGGETVAPVHITGNRSPQDHPDPSGAASESAQNSVSATQWVRITTAAALREEPKPTSPEMLEAIPDEWFPVLREEDHWYEVRLGDSQSGWVPEQGTETTKLTENRQVISIQADAPIFSGPDVSFGPVRTARPNHVYVPNRVSGQWIELQGEGETASWIKASDAIWTHGEPASIAAFNESGEGVDGNLQAAKGPLEGKTIVVDPGHGGIDSGARGKIEDVYERDVNLSVARALKHKLQAAGAKVLMTRTSNDQTVTLQSRVDLSNRSGADLFVSIHQNMFVQDPSVSGTITFYSGPESAAPAKAIEEAALASLGSREEKEHVEQDQLYVLRNNRQPAVLIEGCFLSNPKELANSITTGYQERLASGVFDGIRTYLAG
ncbi:N-acetylmuramoyl-L-alanine amidase [Cohnella zeiphila]|uniref:N-acetylmuramoyl-L-alanine amidase n=1 Tax=Cohnella zeiphila TaxID=2761120 RepID=A0A7X0SRU7_9BACL|nr:N-acetylmuramoyl-L-alanine amidase [Cohnella zeiphila]MBB6734801.1 N-acetylmuramoyl-L-alanine amidase [Cohnella zeiphila]